MKAKKKTNKLNRVDVGLEVLALLKVNCKDDWEAANILIALFSSLCLAHKFSFQDTVNLATDLILHYRSKHAENAAVKAKPKSKAKAKPKAKPKKAR
jgi:hypothetical protein